MKPLKAFFILGAICAVCVGSTQHADLSIGRVLWTLLAFLILWARETIK